MQPIPENEVIQKLEFDNPWWKSSRIEDRFNKLPKRFYFAPLYKLIQERSVHRAVVLMGPRRVGKTVMLYHAIASLLEEKFSETNILYASLDTPLYSGLPLQKILNLFLAKFSHEREDKLVIIFDEIQYLAGWEIHLKSLVDSYPSYKFIATGSAAAALKLKSSESGAGRFTDFHLPPLTFAEYLSFRKQDQDLIEWQEENKDDFGHYVIKDQGKLNVEFINYLNYGGYPEAIFSEAIQKDSARYIQSDIIDKVLLRDLPSLYGIDDIQELYQLFNVLAYNTGNEVSLEDLSKSSHVAKNTLKKYIEYLEAAFLIKIIYRVDLNAKKFKRATAFKVYLTNPSMRAALFGAISDGHEAIGRMVETAIFSQFFHGLTTDSIHYARWKKGEVDMVYLRSWDQKLLGCCEIKWSDIPAKDHNKLKSLSSFCKTNALSDAIVTTKTITQQGFLNNTQIVYVPSALYTFMVGKSLHGVWDEHIFQRK